MYIKLLGKKINLRKVRDSDAESIFLHANDEEIIKAVPLPTPYTLKCAKEYINTTKKLWKKKEEAQFGIELNKEIVGMIGLMHLDTKSAEVGYWLGKAYWGQGIAKESLQLILNYAFKDLKLPCVFAEVKPD